LLITLDCLEESVETHHSFSLVVAIKQEVIARKEV